MSVDLTMTGNSLGGGERGEGAAWALIPSIFPKLDWLMIPGEGGDDMLVLPWSELERVLGNRLEAVDEDAFFVPGQEDMGTGVVARLRGAAASARTLERPPSNLEL